MKKSLILAIGFVFLLSFDASATAIEMVGNYVKTAISGNGTLGTGASTSPGLLHDPSGTGTFGVDDYLTPGSPWEIFSVNSDESGLLTNNNTGTDFGSMVGVLSGSGRDVTWTGSYGGLFDISHHYFFDADDERINIVTTISALVDLSNLQFARAIDPDPDVITYGSYDTVNGRGYDANSDGDFDDAGDVAPEDWVHSEGSNTGLTLGLFSDSAIAHNTGVDDWWDQHPATYLAGVMDGNGDYSIGIGFDIGTLSAGSAAVLEYAYVMGGSLGTVDIPGDPVPEPATMLLFGLGLLGLAGVSRRQK